MNKRINVVFIVFLVVLFIATIPCAYAKNISTDFPEAGNSIEKLDKSVKKVWGTVVLIVQILAVAAVVFAGLRYMYASADRRADIKKSLIILVIGAMLVFATSTILSFVVNVTNKVLEN